jgi:hypothetical protein
MRGFAFRRRPFTSLASGRVQTQYGIKARLMPMKAYFSEDCNDGNLMVSLRFLTFVNDVERMENKILTFM